MKKKRITKQQFIPFLLIILLLLQGCTDTNEHERRDTIRQQQDYSIQTCPDGKKIPITQSCTNPPADKPEPSTTAHTQPSLEKTEEGTGIRITNEIEAEHAFNTHMQTKSYTIQSSRATTRQEKQFYEIIYKDHDNGVTAIAYIDQQGALYTQTPVI